MTSCGVLGRAGEARVLEAIHAGRKPAADLLGPMGVRHDGQAALVRLPHHGGELVQRHLILVDQLDDVDPGVGESLDFRSGVVGAGHAPAEELRARVRRLLNERARHVHRGAGDLAGVDAIANGDARLERSSEIARARDARQQELLRRRRHDDRLELRRIRLVPMGVVAVPVDHEVDVHVPESGQDRHPLGRDHLGARRHGQRPDLTHRGDALALDEDDAVANRPAAEAIDERPADERFHRRGALGRRRRHLSGGEGGDRQRQPVSRRPRRAGMSAMLRSVRQHVHEHVDADGVAGRGELIEVCRDLLPRAPTNRRDRYCASSAP